MRYKKKYIKAIGGYCLNLNELGLWGCWCVQHHASKIAKEWLVALSNF